MMRKNNVSYPAIEDFLEQPVSYPGVAANVTHNIPIFPVGYCPDNNYTRSIMESATIRWNLFNESSFLFSVPFASAEQLDKAYMNESFVGVGVIFHDPDFNQLNYTLRFPSEFVPPTSKPYIRTGGKYFFVPLSRHLLVRICCIYCCFKEYRKFLAVVQGPKIPHGYEGKLSRTEFFYEHESTS